MAIPVAAGIAAVQTVSSLFGSNAAAEDPARLAAVSAAEMAGRACDRVSIEKLARWGNRFPRGVISDGTVVGPFKTEGTRNAAGAAYDRLAAAGIAANGTLASNAPCQGSAAVNAQDAGVQANGRKAFGGIPLPLVLAGGAAVGILAWPAIRKAVGR